jgi:hypothetical protein
VSPQVGEGGGEIDANERIAGGEVAGLLQRLKGFLLFLQIEEGIAPIQIDDRILWIELFGTLKFSNGLFVAAQLVEAIRHVDQHRGVVGIKGGGATELLQRFLESTFTGQFDASALKQCGARRVALVKRLSVSQQIRIAERQRRRNGGDARFRKQKAEQPCHCASGDDGWKSPLPSHLHWQI